MTDQRDPMMGLLGADEMRSGLYEMDPSVVSSVRRAEARGVHPHVIVDVIDLLARSDIATVEHVEIVTGPLIRAALNGVPLMTIYDALHAFSSGEGE